MSQKSNLPIFSKLVLLGPTNLDPDFTVPMISNFLLQLQYFLHQNIWSVHNQLDRYPMLFFTILPSCFNPNFISSVERK